MDALFPQTMTVSQVTALIKRTLEEGFYGLSVSGEISDFRPASTGHWFFSLKDKDALIHAVMFKSKTWKVPFSPKDGDKVVVKGHLDVYAPRGSYQIVCDSMEQEGIGDILAMLEARKQAYAAMGWFDASCKRPIPLYPKKVGVVTSPTGAALHDVLQILGRRAPSLDVVVLPCVVQGDGAGATIARRITEANLLQLCDVLIVGRGGGSLEDLLPFSDDAVVRAIHESAIPVISGVGHEIDWALSDFVADLRAPTPSAAAELASKGYYDLRMSLRGMETGLTEVMERRLASASRLLAMASPKVMEGMVRHRISETEFRLANAEGALASGMRGRIDKEAERCRLLAQQLLRFRPEASLARMSGEASSARLLLERAYAAKVERCRSEVAVLKGRLEALSPLGVLERGYSVVMAEDGDVVRKRSDAPVGTNVTIRFSDGKRGAVIKE